MKAAGLSPGTRHYYRFRSGGAVSEVGTFVTAPDPDVSQPVAFVFSGDSDGSHNRDGNPVYGTFDVLATALDEDPSFFLYLGDTIYADHGGIRNESAGARQAKYRENRGYDALRNILRETSIVAAWDDHETHDGAGGDFTPALAAGLEAFLQYFPLDVPDPFPIFGPMHRTLRWGKHARTDRVGHAKRSRVRGSGGVRRSVARGRAARRTGAVARRTSDRRAAPVA